MSTNTKRIAELINEGAQLSAEALRVSARLAAITAEIRGLMNEPEPATCRACGVSEAVETFSGANCLPCAIKIRRDAEMQ